MNPSHYSLILGPCARRSSLYLLLPLLTFLSAAATAFADPPSNDYFTNAFTLRGYRGAVSVPTAEATKEPLEPAHAGNAGGASVWFQWTAAVAGQLTLDTTAANYDTVLAVYVGESLGSLVLVAANDDNPAMVPRSLVRFRVTAGETYRIAVDGFDGVRGQAVLAWSFLPAPVNDNFADALGITGLCGTVHNFSLAATREANEPEHAGNVGGASVWFR